MKVVYLAGPFRAKPDPLDQWTQWENIRRAAALALEVWRSGAACLCPHTNTAFFQGAAPDDVWLDGDLELLARCDAVLLTPDWSMSSGATAERKFAESRGIRVFESIDDLRAWLSRGEMGAAMAWMANRRSAGLLGSTGE